MCTVRKGVLVRINYVPTSIDIVLNLTFTLSLKSGFAKKIITLFVIFPIVSDREKIVF